MSASCKKYQLGSGCCACESLGQDCAYDPASPVQGAASDPVKAAIAKWDSMPDAKMPEGAASASGAKGAAVKPWQERTEYPHAPAAMQAEIADWRTLAERAQAQPSGAVHERVQWWLALQRMPCPYNERDHGTNWQGYAHVWTEAIVSAMRVIDPQRATPAPEQEAAPCPRCPIQTPYGPALCSNCMADQEATQVEQPDASGSREGRDGCIKCPRDTNKTCYYCGFDFWGAANTNKGGEA